MFAGAATVGTKILARMASRIAAYATAAPWFPPEAAATPTSGILRMSKFANAPRALNDPECCNSSSFSVIGNPASPKSPPLTVTTGVTRTYGRITSRTLSISRRPTPLTTGEPPMSKAGGTATETNRGGGVGGRGRRDPFPPSGGGRRAP
jgi:hypothetical protein